MQMISNEERKRLNEKAREKNYAVTMAFPPQRLLVFNKKTGRNAGFFETVSECEEFIGGLSSYVHVEIDADPVGWTVNPQLAAPLPRRCSNGGGADCLCLVNGSDGVLVFCAVNGCDWAARCKGSCDFHYGHIKLFGDLTKVAVSKTQGLIEIDSVGVEEDSEGCSHGGPGWHTYSQVLERWESGERQKPVSLKQMVGTSENPSTRGAAETKILSELLGVNIRPVGEGFAVIDGSGNMLAYGVNRKELLEEFYG